VQIKYPIRQYIKLDEANIKPGCCRWLPEGALNTSVYFQGVARVFWLVGYRAFMVFWSWLVYIVHFNIHVGIFFNLPGG